jgi:hypothetical protein
MARESSSVPELIDTLRRAWLGSDTDFERKLHAYYVACCRAIWPLLPQDGSRDGVAIAERYLRGDATDADLRRADRGTEGAAFTIDYNSDPDAIARWVGDVWAMPREQLRGLLQMQTVDPFADISARTLLKEAAYFADFAVCYPHLRYKDVDESHEKFLSRALLNGVFGEGGEPDTVRTGETSGDGT